MTATAIRSRYRGSKVNIAKELVECAKGLLEESLKECDGLLTQLSESRDFETLELLKEQDHPVQISKENLKDTINQLETLIKYNLN